MFQDNDHRQQFEISMITNNFLSGRPRVIKNYFTKFKYCNSYEFD